MIIPEAFSGANRPSRTLFDPGDFMENSRRVRAAARHQKMEMRIITYLQYQGQKSAVQNPRCSVRRMISFCRSAEQSRK